MPGIRFCRFLVAPLLLLASTDVALANPPNLVSAWKGDGDAADSGPAGNHGALVGDTTFAPGVFGQAFSFDGTGDYVGLGTSSSFRQSTAITYSFWANLPAGGGGWAMGAGASGGHGRGGVYLDPSSLFFAWTPTNQLTDTFAVVSGLGLSPGTWVHVAVVVDFRGSRSVSWRLRRA